MKKRLLGQGLLMLALLGLCGQGACSRFYLVAASTGSYMNAEQGGAPTAVRLFMYQLTHLPPRIRILKNNPRTHFRSQRNEKLNCLATKKRKSVPIFGNKTTHPNC